MDDVFSVIGRAVVLFGMLAIVFWLGADYGQFSCAKHGLCAGYDSQAVASQSQPGHR